MANAPNQKLIPWLVNTFDLLISTVPEAYAMQPFINVLKPDATLVNVGAMEQLQEIGRAHV